MKGEKRDGRMFQILRGNVHFEQNGSLVTCDDAEYDSQEEEMHGNGHVVIRSSEGVVVTGSRLIFNNKQKVARVEGGVRLVDKEMTLTTPWINYHTDSRIGYYGSGGRIVDGNQVLTSVTGSYNPNIKTLFFRYNVVLTNPEYTVKTDTLQYNSGTGETRFYSYTEITSEENTILCNFGRYNSQTGKSYFTRNAAILSKENIIRADTLSYDRNTGIGQAFGHLWVKDTSQKIIIFGSQGYYDKKQKYTRVTGHPLARKYENNGDSLMLRADTFIYRTDTMVKKRFLVCYPSVKMWRPDFSGTADSLSYVAEDSLFYLFGKPVLWNATTRLNADTMRIWLKNSRISLMQMRGNSFVAIDEDHTHYSQISGRDMDNYFTPDNKLKSVHVTQEGKSVYYAKEKDSTVTSANAVECSNMAIYMDSGKVSNVRFYLKPKGNIYPVDQLPATKEKLVGFVWDEINRPDSEDFTPDFSVPDLPRKREEALKKRKEESTMKKLK
jgi:lipopolysaccharide export system protein LptA